MIIKTFLTLLGILSLVAGIAMSDEFSTSQKALLEGRTDDAIAALSDLVVKENPEALYQTGIIYLNKPEPNPDKAIGFKLLVKASEMGHQLAEVNIAWILIQRFNKIEDGLILLNRAANNGNSLARNDLGHLYLNGDFVDKNIDAAIEHLEIAGQLGQENALLSLANLYSNEIDVPANFERSLQYNLLALEAGSATAKFNLSLMYFNGQGTDKDTNKALLLLKDAADSGVIPAQVNLGALYANGEEVDRDYNAALKWYFEAAKQNDALAQHNLGLMYYYGQGAEANRDNALMWLMLAEHNGSESAREMLGELASNVPKEDMKLAHERAKNCYETHFAECML